MKQHTNARTIPFPYSSHAKTPAARERSSRLLRRNLSARTQFSDYNQRRMHRSVAYVVLCASLASAQSDSDADTVLNRVRARIKEHLAQLPSYTCAQTIQRTHRAARDGTFQLKDTVRLDVALIDHREQFGWPDGKKFEDKELRDMIRTGVVGTGNFALLTDHIFRAGAADFKSRGEEVYEGRRVLQFDYDVPWENSRYHIGASGQDQVVAFRGSFLVDADTLDLVRLEVVADEIPPELKLDAVRSVLSYAKVTIGSGESLLPKASELTMVWLDGSASRNRTELGNCRQYTAQSKLVANDPPPATPVVAEEPQRSDPAELPRGVNIDVSLDSDIDLRTAAAGDAVSALLIHPLTVDGRTLAEPGAMLRGHIVRLDRLTRPFEFYEIALQFDTLDVQGASYDVSATLGSGGPAAGLIRQQKRMDPTFTAHREARLNVLVREVQRGQGVLQWEGKRPKISKGFRMRWRLDEVRLNSGERARR